MQARRALMAGVAAMALAALCGCNSAGLGSLSETAPAPTPRVDQQPLAGPAPTVGAGPASGC